MRKDEGKKQGEGRKLECFSEKKIDRLVAPGFGNSPQFSNKIAFGSRLVLSLFFLGFRAENVRSTIISTEEQLIDDKFQELLNGYPQLQPPEESRDYRTCVQI